MISSMEIVHGKEVWHRLLMFGEETAQQTLNSAVAQQDKPCLSLMLI